MKYYYLCKKYIEWQLERKENFKDYANITEEQWINFSKFMNNKYGIRWYIRECKKNIDECNRKYIGDKLNELL